MASVRALSLSPAEQQNVSNRTNRPKGNETFRNAVGSTWPVRDTPYSMIFQAPMAPLNQDHARRCITFARSQIDSYIQIHGDRPVPSGVYDLIYDYKSVYFTIEPSYPPTERRLMYSDTVKVLLNYAAENTLDGFRERSAHIFVTEGGIQVATAFLGLA